MNGTSRFEVNIPASKCKQKYRKFRFSSGVASNFENLLPPFTRAPE
jgi:hypothetical protein